MSPPVTGAPFGTWQAAWAAWAESSGLSCAWARQAGNPPEMRKPFVRLEVLTVRTLGNDAKGQVFDEDAEEMRETIAGLREITLGVQVVANSKPDMRESAWAWMDELIGTLKDDARAEAFRQAGLSVSSVGQIIDLGGLEQSEFVSRVNCDVVFIGAYYRLAPDPSGWINRVIGTGDVEGNPDPEITFDVEGP